MNYKYSPGKTFSKITIAIGFLLVGISYIMTYQTLQLISANQDFDLGILVKLQYIAWTSAIFISVGGFMLGLVTNNLAKTAKYVDLRNSSLKKSLR